MLVTRLSLTDFRNYKTLDVALGAGANLFVGSNGQGKTNLVEALGYLSTLGSHRVSTDHAMIRVGMDSAVIRARIEHDERSILAEVQLNRSGANRAQVNRSAIRTRELPRYFSSVLFAPEDIALVRGEPSGRRRFLDELLVLRSPRYAAVIADYDRVVRQRNTLLKSARASGMRNDRLSTLDIWDERLVGLGAQLVEGRHRLVAELRPAVTASYLAVVGADHSPTLTSRVSLFDTSVDEDEPAPAVTGADEAPLVIAEIESAFRAALVRVRKAEIDRALTLVGPHRDDLILGLNGMPARGYASHGESWSFALALKLAAAQVLREDSATGDPVLILDDLFAELDQSRRAKLADAIDGFDQVLITAAVLSDVPEGLVARTVHIRAGAVVE